ncbi:MAG: PqiC family protein [Proteobacteria bacterium]|nr:PqiC family protein [Pseudomonadota bacterium]
MNALPRRRPLLLALLALPALAGCGQSPPVQLYRLRAEPPQPFTPPPPSAERWQLLQPVRLPDYLDREAILLPQGRSGVLALSGHRWAESLRDAVPRLLRQDLALLLGEAQVAGSPLPPGWTPTRLLRVELLALEADADTAGAAQAVRWRARWSVSDPTGQRPPQMQVAELRVPAAGASIDDLVAAHRQALWELARRIAAGG